MKKITITKTYEIAGIDQGYYNVVLEEVTKEESAKLLVNEYEENEFLPFEEYSIMEKTIIKKTFLGITYKTITDIKFIY